MEEGGGFGAYTQAAMKKLYRMYTSKRVRSAMAPEKQNMSK
jgi:hypothetical protein